MKYLFLPKVYLNDILSDEKTTLNPAHNFHFKLLQQR